MRALDSVRGGMHGQLTISGAIARFLRFAATRPGALVITSVVLFGQQGTPVAAAATLTTTSAPALTTVVVNGSTVYSPPQLFAAYRSQLGQPISRDGARAIVSALSDLYLGD